MGVKRTRLLVRTQSSGWARRGLSGPTSDDLRQLAREHDWRFAQVDLYGVQTKDDLMDRVASALSFPDHFGRTWDALLDCLRDVAGPHGVIMRLKGLPTLDDELAQPFVEVLDARMHEAKETGGCVPMLVVSDPPLPARSR